MIAKHNGRCNDRCGLRIYAGHDEIERGHFGWRHVDCETANLRAQIRERMAAGATADVVWAWLERSEHLTVDQRIDAIFYASRGGGSR